MSLAAFSNLSHPGVLGIYKFGSPQQSFLQDALSGLALPQKAIAPKYFYDARGSRLFERICELPEYYPTRTEMAIMHERTGAVAERAGPDCQLIELGSGSSLKTRLLIDALQPSLYIPFELSESALRQACADLQQRFPQLNINAVIGDFSAGLQLPEFAGLPCKRKLVYFPGSTIGNFTRVAAARFLHNVRALVGTGGMLLIGIDLKKDRAVLEAAYNDAQGVTAAFNLNLLHRMNRELGADFQIDQFRHLAFYNVKLDRIEMHLQSACVQTVHIADQHFEFTEGETIHTEISCKYDVQEFQTLARAARFFPEAVWTDPQRLFSVHLMMAI